MLPFLIALWMLDRQGKFAAAPFIDTILPGLGSVLGNVAVVIGGTGFLPGAQVSIGGRPATLVVRVSDILITAVTPLGGLGSADVLVTNPDGKNSGSSGAGLFIYI